MRLLILMSQPLPRLRLNLDFLPSPDPGQPGLYIRDPFRYSDAMLLIPPPLVASLACFDGEQTDVDLRASLVRATGELQVGELETHLIDTLSEAGFLENDRFTEMRQERQQEFAAAPKREASHSGTAYPEDTSEVRRQLTEYMTGPNGRPSPGTPLIGIAAPHVSPFGGWESYRAAYRLVSDDYRDRTFVVLGTSHYGEPDRFGLTRKPFVTPLGETSTALDLVDELESKGGPAAKMEDYCHAVEHSIEFQVLFLQYLFGPDIRILPVLCGSFAKSLYFGGKPEDSDDVKRFLGALGDLGAREAARLFWVLGIDMAHMGVRYGDRVPAKADQGEMLRVADRDRDRIDRINAGDAPGFWGRVQQNHDDLKWCGSAPLYTFLKAVPEARGDLHLYQQWNIDEQSVVSFAGLAFSRAA